MSDYFIGLDTSTPVGSVCLLGEDGKFVEASFLLTAGPSRLLMSRIEAAAEDLGIDPKSIAAVGAGVGPGSFTGLRVGLATAKGLALSLNVPTYPFPSLEILAAGVPKKGLVMAVLDARKGQVFAALYRSSPTGRKLLWGPAAVQPEDLPVPSLQGKIDFVGTGVGAFEDRIRAGFKSRAVFLPPIFWYPRAAVIARWTRDAFAAEGKPAGFIDRLDPIYGRKSEAELGYEGRIAALDGKEPSP